MFDALLFLHFWYLKEKHAKINRKNTLKKVWFFRNTDSFSFPYFVVQYLLIVFLQH
jgi:hypothetical protein